MRLGGVQPSYLPWLGYFEQIYKTDVFILCDELQYEIYSWRNRNKIKTKDSWMWLTVPVPSSNTFGKPIKDIKIAYNRDWRRKHWLSLTRHYNKTPFFKDYRGFFEEVYKTKWEFLAELDIEIIRELCRFLGIKTELVVSSQLKLEEKFRRFYKNGDATDRLVFYCKEFGADIFYEGEAGKNYIDEQKTRDNSITLEYQTYQHPVYPQRGADFTPYLSVVDLLFNCGEKSLNILADGSLAPSRE